MTVLVPLFPSFSTTCVTLSRIVGLQMMFTTPQVKQSHSSRIFRISDHDILCPEQTCLSVCLPVCLSKKQDHACGPFFYFLQTAIMLAARSQLTLFQRAHEGHVPKFRVYKITEDNSDLHMATVKQLYLIRNSKARNLHQCKRERTMKDKPISLQLEAQTSAVYQ